MAVNPYGRTTRRSGVTLNLRTVEMLEISELRSLDRLGIVPLALSQGSYTSSTPQSGGTHDGGGALDVRCSPLSEAQIDSVVWALRKTGFAAWHRTPSQGDWPEHIHAIAIGDREVSSAAAQQVAWYKQGLNGLWGAAQGPDDGPRFNPIPIYRQDIDLSYYGPEKWDDPDFTRLFTRLMDWPVGKFNRPSDGAEENADVAAALRAARWCLYRLGDNGLDEVAAKLFTTDGIFRNLGVDPAVDPQGAYLALSTLLSNMEDTQDKDHATLAEIKTAVTSPPA